MQLQIDDGGAVPVRSVPPKHCATLIAMMAGMGMRSDLVPILADMAGMKMTADERRWMSGPLVVHQNGWTDTLPRWMIDQVKWERAEILFGLADPRMIVGPTEIAAVMYPATMAHPMRTDACDLYLWASVNASCRNFGHDKAEMWKRIVGNHPIVTDDEVLENTGLHDVSHLYQRLAHDIRRKVANHARVSDRITYHVDDKVHGDAAKPVKAKPEVVRDLFSMFDEAAA